MLPAYRPNSAEVARTTKTDSTAYLNIFTSSETTQIHSGAEKGNAVSSVLHLKESETTTPPPAAHLLDAKE
jgi:hypothetical protein